MKVIHFNTYDEGGGAEQFACDFVNNSETDAYLFVKSKKTSSGKVIELPKNILDRALLFIDKVLWKTGIKKTFKQCFSFTEESNFTYEKISRLDEYRKADIVHLHNIHGGFFECGCFDNTTG